MPIVGPSCFFLNQGVLAYDEQPDFLPNGVIPDQFVGTVEVETGETDEFGDPVTEDQELNVQLLPGNRLGVEVCYQVTAPFAVPTNPFAGSPLGGGILGGTPLAQDDLVNTDASTNFVYQICDSEARFNEAVTITADMIGEGGAIEFEVQDYILGVVGVSTTQVSEPDGDFGIDGEEVDDPDNIGGLNVPSITVTDNLFETIVFNERSEAYTGSEDALAQDGAVEFVTGGTNRLVSKKIRLKADSGLAEGDVVYVTYSAASNRRVRHGVEIETGYTVLILLGVPIDVFPQFVRRRAWNYLPFEFLIPSDPEATPSLNLSGDQLETVEAQRIVEFLGAEQFGLTRTKRFVTMDQRGIILVTPRISSPDTGFETDDEGEAGDLFNVSILVPASNIRDQEWFNSYIQEQSVGLAFTNPARGEGPIGFLKTSDEGAMRQYLRGMLFDVSDHVNGTVTDAQKTPYARDFALALSAVGSEGVGVPNLDLIIADIEGRSSFDLTSAVFRPQPMATINAGAWGGDILSALAVGNQVRGDGRVTVPFFFYGLGTDARLFIEFFNSPGDSSGGDRVFFVRTSAVSVSEGISVASNPSRRQAIAAFPGDNSKLSILQMDDVALFRDTAGLVRDNAVGHRQNTFDTYTAAELDRVGYNQVKGSQPNFSLGKILAVEVSPDEGFFLSDMISRNEVGLDIIDDSTREINLSAFGNTRVRSLILDYEKRPGYDDQPSKRFHAFFNGTELGVDNIFLTPVNKGTNRQIIPFGYYSGEQITLKGDILQYIDVKKAVIETVPQTTFDSITIETAGVSVCYDARGTIYIFFEDSRVEQQTISCLVSYDNGVSWYPFYDIVLNPNGNNITKPYAVADWSQNRIHLFYLIENELYYKVLDTRLFARSEAFFEATYLQEEVEPSFVPDINPYGQDLTGVDIGNMPPRQKTLRTSLTYLILGNLPEQDYAAFQDASGQLYVLYVDGGRAYALRGSPANNDWEQIFPNGFSLHQGNPDSEEEFVPITKIGVSYGRLDNLLRIAYIANDSIYYKNLPIQLMKSGNVIFDPVNPNVVGPNLPLLRDYLIYDVVDARLVVGNGGDSSEDNEENQDSVPLNISEIAPVGYHGSNGFVRFLYKDDQDFLRSFFLNLFKTPTPESRLRNR